MTTRGIYIVCNNKVANQVIALLNSLKVHWPEHPSIIVVPYDDDHSEIVKLIKHYDNVTFYSNEDAIARCDKYFIDLWSKCPRMIEAWQSKNKEVPFRLGMHRRFVGYFDPMFDQFVYLDSDIYVNNDLTPMFQWLDDYECVGYDQQHTGPQHVFNLESPLVKQFGDDLTNKIQCAGFILSRSNAFTEAHWEQLNETIEQEQEIFYPWGPDQTLLNYMINKFGKKFINLGVSLPESERTFDAQTYTKFTFKDGVLYQDDKRLTYFHHIGVPADEFNLLCEGKRPKHEFRYQNVFLYYRYLFSQSQCPDQTVFENIGDNLTDNK